ncbi:serine/threonine protein kinase [Myxococcota bacterium]|nr:serine/threonine protein kinase [Myxococcota bacterium]
MRRLLGAGGFGEVWEVDDPSRGEPVALKVLGLGGAVRRARWSREVAALDLARLPGVVTLYDHGVDEAGRGWITMALVEGAPFPRGPWSRLEPIVEALLETLHQVHSVGLVHRDLKPSNVLVTGAGRPVILDFGLVTGDAAADLQLTQVGAPIGTPRYLAPEQLQGRARVDGRADLYALGVMLYEALTGEPPHRGEDALRLGLAKLNEPPVPVDQRVPDLPPAAADLVMRLLSRDPADRPTAAEALRALRGAPILGAREGAYLGDPALIDALAARLAAGETFDLYGPPGAGRTRTLVELARRLPEARWTVAAARPYASLRPVLPPRVFEDGLDAASALAALDSVPGPLLADDLGLLDPWTQAALTAATPRRGLVRVREAPGAVRLEPLSAEAVAALFDGKERLHHVPSRAAKEVLRRTGGLAGRVATLRARWVRDGIAAETPRGLTLSLVSLERLAAEPVLPWSAARAPALPAEQEELLRWLILASPHQTVERLSRLMERPVWELNLQLDALCARGLARREGALTQPMAEPSVLWSPERLQAARARLAERLPAGAEGRLGHLLAAGVTSALEEELLALVPRLIAAGAVPDAIRALWAARRELPESRVVRETLTRLLLARADRRGLDEAVEVARGDHRLERLVRAHRAAHARRVAEVDEALGPPGLFDDDPELAMSAMAAQVRGVRGEPAEVQGALLRRLAEHPATRSSADAEARFMTWMASHHLISRRFAEASRLHREAASRRTSLTGRLHSLDAAALADRERGDVEGMEALAEQIQAEAQAAGLVVHEAQAEWLKRSAAARRGAVTAPDLELVALVEPFRDWLLSARVNLTEGFIALRVGHPAAGALAKAAEALFAAQGIQPGVASASALRFAATGEGDVATILNALLASGSPAVKLDGLAILAAAGARFTLPKGQVSEWINSLGEGAGPLRIGVYSMDEALHLLSPLEESTVSRLPPIFTRLALTDLAAPVRLPAATPRRDTFNPVYDAGGVDVWEDGDAAGVSYVTAHSASSTTEDSLLRDTTGAGATVYPGHAPRVPSSSAPSAVVEATTGGFTDRDNFLDGARGHLGLGSNESCTYARAKVKRYKVTDVSALAGAVSEVSPASKKITRLVGVNGANQMREGWVYVETSTTSNGETVRVLHQIYPADLILPPSGVLTLEGYNNSTSDWDLAGLITAKATVNGRYDVCRCTLSVVSSQAALDSASAPSDPATPSAGVTAWT